jgi:hypothetical protein
VTPDFGGLVLALLRCIPEQSTVSVTDVMTSNLMEKELCHSDNDRGVGIRVPVGDKNFPFSTSSRPALGPTLPPIQWVPGALSPVVKRPGGEADHSPPTSA